jgi:hypothetical protein
VLYIHLTYSFVTGETSRFPELRIFDIDEVQVNGAAPRDKVAMRDVGIECCVLTRDVGVTHPGPKLRTVGTQSTTPEPSKNLLSFSTIRSETILPSAPAVNSFHADELNRKQPEGEESSSVKARESRLSFQADTKMKLRTVDNATNTLRAEVKHVSCSTDIRMNQIYTETEVERMVEEHGKKILRDDEALRVRRRVDKGVLAKPRCSDIAIAAVPRLRDTASSDCTINDVLCEKCNTRKRSIGVGSTDFLRVTADGAPASLASLTMTRSKSSDHFNLRPRLRATSVKGTDTRDLHTSVKSTDTRDLHTFRDTAVNTMKRKLVDTGVGERISTRDVLVETTEPLNVVTECTKCLARAESPQPTYTLSPSSTTPSRIPRLAKPVTPTSSQNGKRPFNRQDTYTKIQVDEKLNLPIVPTITVDEEDR